MKTLLYFWNAFLIISTTNSSFNDYINGIGNYLGFYQTTEDDSTYSVYNRKIPYEVSTVDEKFISEAAKLTGVALSELDSCQYRVVLKLNTDCDKMNDEHLAKMAVHLLNCQSFVEGRSIFPCTDEMSIKQCTINMDPDTWTSYHLMSNRVKAVCYSIRQTLFRGQAEHTVNSLMDAAQNQLKTLRTISDNQNEMKHLVDTTYDTLTKGHEILTRQQEDIQKAQFHGQLAIEHNIQRLTDEKRLIVETHGELTQMTKAVQDKLEYSLKQLDDQTDESRINHKELLEDLLAIQTKTQEIFKKIDESSSLLIKQNEDFKLQYISTLTGLREVNNTVHSLIALVGGTRHALEEKLTWITSALGGTDLAIERIYLIMWHVAFMLIAMLTCAFLSARASTRLVVATLPPLNLAVALYDSGVQHLDFISLLGGIGIFIIVQLILISTLSMRKTAKAAIPWIQEKVTPVKQKYSPEKTVFGNIATTPSVSSTPYQEPSVYSTTQNNSLKFPLNEDDNDSETSDNFRDFDLTPPVSRNGYYNFINRSKSRSNTPLRLNTSLKGSCRAKTRVGTPCKLSALAGRDYCYRHQTGDSVMG